MWPNVWRGQHLIIDKASCWRNVIRCLPLQMTDNNTGKMGDCINTVDGQSPVKNKKTTTTKNNNNLDCNPDLKYCLVCLSPRP